MRAAIVAVTLFLSSGPALAQDNPPAPPSAEPDKFNFIGRATMSADGTITLDLVSDDNGLIAHGHLVYSPSDPHYDIVLKHIGPLSPGETKPVAPWPD